MDSRHFYKIPATIVTGFLGAGKTTFIRHLLENNHGRRIAVIINEFGDVGMDSTLLEGCGVAACDDIIELANGCICCSVADTFVPVIEKLVENTHYTPDHIIIETSGLALPKPLVQAFQWPMIRARVMVNGVVVVVDATTIVNGPFFSPQSFIQKTVQLTNSAHSDDPVVETFTDQLSCADIVLLNKIDLIEGGLLAEGVQELASLLRAGVRLLPVRYCRANADLLLGLETETEAHSSYYEKDHRHDHDDFECFTLLMPPILDIEDFERSIIVATTTHNIFRIKGFLDVPGKAMRLVVQGVGTRIQRYFDRPWKAAEPRCGRLVIIGLKGLNRRAIAMTINGNAYQE